MLEDNILAKIFPRSLKDTDLEWFSSIPTNSIHSFDKLVEEFINYFQVNMIPKMTLVYLMRCKTKDEENITNFIS
jgi:hypothetical protein